MPPAILTGSARARLRPCLRCGYSLRNNIEARNCPECGLAVRVSLRGDDNLDWSNPRWVRRMARAALALTLCYASLLVAVVCNQVGYFGSVTTYPDGTIVIGYGTADRLADIFLNVSTLLLGLGAILLAGNEGRFERGAAVIRGTLLVVAAIVMALAALEVLAEFRLVPRRWLWLYVGRWPDWVLAAPIVVLALVEWFCVYELARRVPSRRAMELVRWLAYTLTLAYLAMAVLPQYRNGLLRYMLRRMPWDPLTWVWTVATPFYAMLALGVMFYCWRAFRSTAREADKNWVTDPA